MLTKPNLGICLVDDDVLCLNLYRQLLKQLGYSDIELFDNGQDCLDSLEKLAPDVIFLDYNMEGLNGMEVLKRIKQFNKDIIVLFISGHENLETAINTMKQGAVDYLLKASLGPEKMREVMERVEGLVPEDSGARKKKSLFQKLFS
jgi:DNA-binding NtrC family response regulator